MSWPKRQQKETLGSCLVKLLSVQRCLRYLHSAKEGLAEQDRPLCVTVLLFRNSRGEVDTPMLQ